jgi:hypothetical protein
MGTQSGNIAQGGGWYCQFAAAGIEQYVKNIAIGRLIALTLWIGYAIQPSTLTVGRRALERFLIARF